MRVLCQVFKEKQLIQENATQEEFVDVYQRTVGSASDVTLRYYAEQASQMWDGERGKQKPIALSLFYKQMRIDRVKEHGKIMNEIVHPEQLALAPVSL